MNKTTVYTSDNGYCAIWNGDYWKLFALDEYDEIMPKNLPIDMFASNPPHAFSEDVKFLEIEWNIN